MLLMLLRGGAFKPHDEHSLKAEHRYLGIFKGAYLLNIWEKVKGIFGKFLNKIRSGTNKGVGGECCSDIARLRYFFKFM